ncbi:NUDIX hydrolase [Streptomyces sp. NBC_00053]|uniref:NUDIX hydrolase n=1 Tax=unclassified Streptomyces TaxID=2593676 RepID=UPI000F5B9BA8|nr:MULTISPECIES: NUDIX domain-containing protein [unclassified Streptomyces]WSG52999.1 NUDIX hydrolase [Streptomyces sp. NBC_01732]WSX03642.1 NUDIX hydrolase [Streptomyces sp. NBC_00987]MCX4394342.1 NUDIX hydrolase [Streptomyces sp. NBC_01767]MCX5103005.1 NUDIX hydrolase [Streptomyces sp. NBC_00439]MCX5162571.1 NUDIX hydrolase [Streptomyces sp. NBC_00305]
MPDDAWSPPPVLLTVDLVILTLRESRLHVLLVERGEEPFQGALALPGGFLNHDEEEILDAAHRELSEETALTSGWVHLEQLAVYGSPGRDPRGRVVSVAHLAIAPGLPDPVAGTDATEAAWIPADAVLSGETALAFDHRRIAEDGIERARAKIEFSALATAFCGESFTIAELQQVYEAVWGTPLDTRNFYRKVQAAKGFIVPTGADRKATGGRPARLYRAGPNTVLFPPLIRPRTTEEEE